MGESRGARAELADFLETGAAGRFSALRPKSAAPGRPAAVLMLFGVLDETPSAHVAADAAVARDLDVLLVERASTLRAHPGQIAFPGGRIDADDADPVAAALREAHEEAGLDPAGVDVLGSLGAVPLEYSRHIVTPVIGWWRQPSPVWAVDAAESADVFRVPVADLLDPANRGTAVLRRGGEEHRGPGFLLPGAGRERLVWGFTAMLLDALFDDLGWSETWDASRTMPLRGV